ncbi:MAG: hypothetical protein AAGG48_29625 [Planctomycetota bacterium]
MNRLKQTLLRLDKPVVATPANSARSAHRHELIAVRIGLIADADSGIPDAASIDEPTRIDVGFTLHR